MSGPDRIVAVSTINDPPAAVDRYLERNLAAGIDHLIVFLDSHQPRVQSMLAEHPCVTVVPTAESYWSTGRPEGISPRLRINANVANAALTAIASVRWLFYIDCDESLSFDREQLLMLEHPVIRFPTWEAVSRASWPTNDATMFKRHPGPRKLALLAALGAIAQPELSYYYRGHHEGKPGARPNLGIRFSSHDIRDAATGEILPMSSPAGMHLLHYESWCLEDFVNRWKGYDHNLASKHAHRDRRKQLGIAFNLLYTMEGMTPRVRRRRIRQFFDRNIADDVSVLSDLGLLATKPQRTFVPRPLPADEIEALESTLAALRLSNKLSMERDAGLGQALAELEVVAGRVEPSFPDAAGRLRLAISHAQVQHATRPSDAAKTVADS